MFYTAGIDVGCSAVKVTLLEHAHGKESLMGYDLNKIRKRNTKEVVSQAYERVLSQHHLCPSNIAYVATTGEGELVDFRTGHFYSMTTHARGAIFLTPHVRTVLDVGALHAKAMVIDDRSKVLSSRMTSQCASGSGQFLENISRYLGVALEDIGDLSLKADKPEIVSSICAVLGETDVINMVSRNVSISNILKGIHLSIGRRLINLLRMLKANGDTLITGGLAKDVGLLAALQELARQDNLPLTFLNHELSVFAGAIGAALWGASRHIRLQGEDTHERA